MGRWLLSNYQNEFKEGMAVLIDVLQPTERSVLFIMGNLKTTESSLSTYVYYIEISYGSTAVDVVFVQRCAILHDKTNFQSVIVGARYG